MKLPTDEDGCPIMAYFGPSRPPGDLQTIDRPDEDCYVCKKRLVEGDRGVVVPYLRTKEEEPDHVAAHIECWRKLVSSGP